MFYMSPEILGREGASFTSDLWSLGVTLYEMVTGTLPFGDLDTPLGELADMIRRMEHRPACELNPEIPSTLSAIIDRSLRKKATDRYTSATEMRETLRQFRQRAQNQIEEEMAAIREAMAGMDQIGHAEAKIQKLVAKYPRDARAYQYLGEFYNRCQRFPEALAAFEKGLEINRDHALLHWDLALVYQRIGRREDAARALKRAIALGLDASLQRHATTLLKVLERDGG
jgi:tetratricopeptide (TPR) repeat protein